MKYLILLWSCYVLLSDCSAIHRAVTLSKQIIRSQNPHRYKKELSLYLQATSTDQSCKHEDLLCIFNALTTFETPLTPYTVALTQSFSRFKHTPGYPENLRLIILKSHNSGLVKGHAYEIERAVALADTGETIQGLNVVLSCTSLCREFDILTKHFAVECKNIRWKNKTIEKLTTQFLEQKKIIDRTNLQHNRDRRFQVSSKQPVPECWQHWFAKHDIDLHEEQSDISRL